MSKFSEIVVSGDSFSAPSDEVYKPKPYLKAGIKIEDLEEPLPNYICWPTLLCKYLEYPIINLSKCGSGNFGVCKRIQDYVIDNHEKIKFCVVALSDWRRLELTSFQMPNTGPVSYFELGNLPKKDIYTTNFVYSTLRSIYELQILCKHFQIPCVIFNMLEPVVKDPHSRDLNKARFISEVFKNPYFKIIDKEYTIGWPFLKELNGHNFTEKYLYQDRRKYCIGNRQVVYNGSLIKTWDWHPNQAGHQILFEAVKTGLENFKLI